MMRIRDLAGDVQPKSKATVHAGEKVIVGTALQWLEYLEARCPGLSEVVLEGSGRWESSPRASRLQIFKPLKRGSDKYLPSGMDGSFGLGLYIASEITNAHHGRPPMAN